jgi:hypothetical protein
MILHTISPGWECPYVILASVSVFLHMYIVHQQLCSHALMFKIWYMTIILSNLLFSAVHVMHYFIFEKMLYGNYTVL